jgi:hypothetical protein
MKRRPPQPQAPRGRSIEADKPHLSHVASATARKGVDSVAYQEQQAQRHGLGGWSRTRWVVLLVAIAIVAAIVLTILYTGGGGSGGGGGGY